MSRKTRKLIWSVPLVAVLAAVGALAIFAAATPGGVFANTAPGAVTDFSVSSDGPTSIKLSWAAPDGGETHTGYRIDWAPSPGHDWSMLVASQTETEYTDMGLVPPAPITAGDHVTRYYRVFALNSHGPGPESDILQASTKGVQPPGAIDDVKATASGAKTINVTWSEPDENGGLPITGYLVVGGDVAGTTATMAAKDAGKKVGADVNMYAATEYWNAAAGTPATAKLSAKTTAHFRVFAINAAGTSMVNSNVDSDTTAKANRPDPPMNLVVVQLDPNDPALGVNLYWHEPEDDGGRAISSYVVVHKQGSGSWMETPLTVLGTDGDNYPTEATAAHDYQHVPTDDGGTANVDESLEKGERVQYRVKSMHSDGTSLVSNTASVTMIDADDADDPDTNRIPETPADVAADGLPGKLRLTWTHELTTGYRIDVSEDGMVWEQLVRNTGLTLELGTTTSHRYDHEDLEPGDQRYYRVLANNGGIYGLAGINATIGTAGAATAPGKTRSLTAVLDASDPTQINVNWSGLAEADTGGAKIRRYLVEVSEDGTDWPDLTVDAGLDATTRLGYFYQDADKTSYQHKSLPSNTRFHYRVRADNSASNAVFNADDNLTAAGDAQVATAKTPAPRKPGMPMSLSAHPASDSNLAGVGSRGVYLTWLKPAKVLGGEITGYNIERKAAGEDTLTDSVNGDRTFYQDTDNLGEQVRQFRVSAESAAGSGPWTEWLTYPLGMHAPGKPTAVMAMKDADMPASKIKVSWSAPANGVEVDGYIIERRYGDMMMDIPSDGYNTGAMGAMHAFMDYKEWWETLNCKGMLAVAGSSASDTATEGESAQDVADRAMYCKHFANTAPTNMAFAGKTVSDDTAMKIKEMFMKRYVTDDMGKTKTMFTGMMYTDMDLMEDTEYTYRVRAIHGMTAGMWSDKAMVMTGSDNMAPEASGTIDPVTVTEGMMSEAMDVSRYFSDAEMDTLTYTATSDMEMYATVSVDGSMVTINGVAAGMATITVKATDMDGSGKSAMQEIEVTVTAAPVELMAPTNIQANPQGSGLVSVSWNTAAGASGYTIIAINVDDVNDHEVKILDDESETSTQISLTSGKTYNIYVGSFAGQEFNLNTAERKRIDVE